MPDIPFPVSSAPGERPQEGAGRLINCFAEKTEPGARFPVIWKRTPGLRQILNITGHSHLRGAIMVGSTLLVAMDERVYAVTESGGLFSASNLGALAGDDAITVAKNNAGTPNIVAVTAQGAKNLFTGSAPTDFADADLPQPNSVAELNGYLLFTIGDGRIFSTGLNNVSVDTNAFATEQSLGGLLRGVSFRGEFFAFGPKGIGVWYDVGASPFPLERHKFTIARGICGTHAVAGWEDGFVDELLWVGENGIVYRLNGYTPELVSSDDVTRDVVAAIRAGEGASLEASIYTVGKHAFWVLTNPGVWTWEYNLTTQNWDQRISHTRDDWRASRTVYAFNRWIAGDRTSGKLFEVDPSYYREDSDPLVWRIRSGAGANFPGRIIVLRADFDMTAAVGLAAGEDPIQTDPVVMIRWSLDGGHSFGDPITRRLGGEGVSDTLVSIARGCGMTKGKGIVFELSVADPVHVGFMGGKMAIKQAAA